jgi:metal transporter CNNM
METLTWLGIVLCLSQSAMLSGSNLAYFTLSKMRLEMETAGGNPLAAQVLAMRQDANFLLVTILWGNVAVNVLLALLSNSVLAGVLAFVFSTVVITIVGEIIPQAYFSRHALRMAGLLGPLLRTYQWVLYPVARPTAMILDRWLGKEAISYYSERDLEEIIRMHAQSSETDIDHIEGRGAINFLAIDDLPVSEEGERIDPLSIVSVPFVDARPVFPIVTNGSDDRFLQRINRSGRKWVVLVDEAGEPRLTLNADTFLRDALFNQEHFNPHRHCHRPVMVRSEAVCLGEILPRLKVHPQRSGDDVIDQDIILLWGGIKRVITGSDILGRLLRGIVRSEPIRPE